VSDPAVLRFRPEPDQYAWTFGGAAPVARVKPPAVLELFTEDCFAGRVRSENDLVTEVCEFPYVNPQTGPFYIEGAEPGDTLAVHFISIEPARDWGASTTVPFFGALTATHATALLHDALPEVVWMWQLDTSKGTCRFAARRGGFEVDLPLNPMHGTVGVAPGRRWRPRWRTCATRTTPALPRSPRASCPGQTRLTRHTPGSPPSRLPTPGGKSPRRYPAYPAGH
jgi:acetamidase/formamidase